MCMALCHKCAHRIPGLEQPSLSVLCGQSCGWDTDPALQDSLGTCTHDAGSVGSTASEGPRAVGTINLRIKLLPAVWFLDPEGCCWSKVCSFLLCSVTLISLLKLGRCPLGF